jgi:hypothetical protein
MAQQKILKERTFHPLWCQAVVCEKCYQKFSGCVAVPRVRENSGGARRDNPVSGFIFAASDGGKA